MKQVLNSIIENTMEGTLKHEVAEILIDNMSDYTNEEVLDYLATINCSSGMVGGMIYYRETEAFFDRHADEIFELYNDLKEECGEPNIELSRNNLAWLAFEVVTQEIYLEVEAAYELL